MSYCLAVFGRSWLVSGVLSDIDLSKFQTVSIYCERFNANFGAAPLEKF